MVGHASGPNARFAGVRTFLLLGLVGGVAGMLLEREAQRGGESIEGTTEAVASVVGLWLFWQTERFCEPSDPLIPTSSLPHEPGDRLLQVQSEGVP